MTASRRLTIFSGVDGSGKTTLAKEYAALTKARYVHFSALPHVTQGLGRLYVEAMQPALLGYQDVVFDRSWLCDRPYGTVYRNGMDRLGDASRRMLERLALRCGAVVVQCDPGWETIKKNWDSRGAKAEMLKDTTQLYRVWELYQHEPTDLPTIGYDFNFKSTAEVHEEVEYKRCVQHPTSLLTAGCWSAKTCLVGEGFAERKGHDPWYQAPFVSFDRQGCSQWLTEQLKGLGEDQLLWINADQDLTDLTERPDRIFCCLGEAASNAVTKYAARHEHGQVIHLAHPQYWKRFRSKEAYPLLSLLRETQ